MITRPYHLPTILEQNTRRPAAVLAEVWLQVTKNHQRLQAQIESPNVKGEDAALPTSFCGTLTYPEYVEKWVQVGACQASTCAFPPCDLCLCYGNPPPSRDKYPALLPDASQMWM